MDEQRKRLAIAQDFRDTFRSLPGARVLERLKIFCHGEFTTVADGPAGVDPYKTLFREGERNVLLFIEAQLEAADNPVNHPDKAATEEEGEE